MNVQPENSPEGRTAEANTQQHKKCTNGISPQDLKNATAKFDSNEIFIKRPSRNKTKAGVRAP
jgi:hypothetical protein